MDTFSDAQFEKYSRYIYDNFGINFKKTKKDILETKLKKLIEKSGQNSYEDYFRLLTNSHEEDVINEFICEITVNKTDFFRESSHFDFIRENAGRITAYNSRIITNREIRAWSAGCATGEEAYTLSMILKESFPGLTIKVLATDIDSEVLSRAIKGAYGENVKNDIDRYYLMKYFSKTETGYCINSNMKNNITFRQFNLMNSFPFKNRFDIIFCRNVMIYFDAEIQQKLLNKFYQVLTPGGLLFLGHTEGITNMKLNYRYLQPAVYIK